MSCLAKLFLKIVGYSIDQSFINAFEKQRVWIFPHTSRCEAFLTMLAVIAIKKGNCFSFPCAKDYIDAPIIGSLLKSFGGFPVVKGSGMVNSSIEFLKKNTDKQFPISPEGSLSSKEWKSGFFYIAKGANLPISIGGIDFVNHKFKATLDKEIIILPHDKYEDRVAEIKDMFAKSEIYPLYEDCSNPRVINKTGYGSTFLPTSRKIVLVTILFGISGYIIYKLI